MYSLNFKNFVKTSGSQTHLVLGEKKLRNHSISVFIFYFFGGGGLFPCLTDLDHSSAFVFSFSWP